MRVVRHGGWRSGLVGVAAALLAAGAVVLVPGRVDATPRAFGAGEVRRIVVSGEAGVPEDGVAAVVVNLTATDVTTPTFVSVWPSGAVRPSTSNLNPVPGQDIANLAVVPLDDTGGISVYNHAGTAHLVVDVVGWIPVSAGFQPAGTRLLDTRDKGARLGEGERRQVPVPGVGGGAAVLNLTGVNASTGTYLTAWRGGEQPPTSNVNVADAAAAANLVMTSVADDGTVTVANHAGSIDVVVDLLGWFPAGAGIQTLAPTRLLDTRATGSPVDPTHPAQVSTAAVQAATGASTDGAFVATVTGVGASARAFVTAWSGGGPRPTTSNLNVRPVVPVANLALVRMAAAGDLHLFLNAGRADLVVDAAAWIPADGAIRAVDPARVYDSRTADASGLLRPPTRNVTYTVAVRGTISADRAAFAVSAAATLADARGWRAAGITFRQVATGGDFTLWLSQAELVPEFGPPCTANYSCRVGRDVIVNEARWRLATPVWTGAGASLADYQSLVVNHEVGHWLGFDHALCAGPGQPAPVMQQQSKGLNGCLSNPWPTPHEIAVLAG